MMTIREWQQIIHQNAVEKGFYENESDLQSIEQIGKRIALIHSEVSEAFEEARSGCMDIYYHPGYLGKPEGFPIELADVVIRILDLAEALKIDMEEAIALKHEFNLTRPPMHGKRC